MRPSAKVDPASAHRMHAPPFEIFKGCTGIFENFNFITHINFIVINIQCLQYVFYSLLSLQKHRVSPPRFLNSWIGHCSVTAAIPR